MSDRHRIDRILPPGIRCTVQMELKGYGAPGKKNMKGKAVGPSAPREHDGTYWGYSVRMASSIKSIFDEAPYKNGYDLKIGTSERGNISVDEEDFLKKISDKVALPTSSATPFQHAVIVFGGVAGIEECVDADETIGISGNDSQSLFDLWVNICEYQGSRTIRTEEAVLIGLSRLCPHLFPINQIDINGKAKKNPTASSRSTSTTVDFSDDEPSEEDSNSDESD
jgi:predicted SPOUT superfamily RNA methylase MTH1